MPIAKGKNVSVTAPVRSGQPLIRSLELSATLVENIKVSLTIAAVSNNTALPNELSETQVLSLQMAMAKEAQLVETLSNVLQAVSSTSDAIVRNLK